jgi:serine/threonine protein kinase
MTGSASRSCASSESHGRPERSSGLARTLRQAAGEMESAAGTGVPDPLAGRYRLLEEIGQGGMGRVFRARDTILDRDVAVKVVDHGPGVGDAYVREARAAARLAHPGIVRVLDTGDDEGHGFVVMDLVAGRTLADVLFERGALSPTTAVEIGAQVADALEHAHSRGVVHCDVKPQNVVMGSHGRPRLIDFGIARAESLTGQANTRTIRGSAPYLAPEQLTGGAVDARADVYSLGTVLYEMVTGRPPFEGATIAAILSQRLIGDPPRPRSLDPRIPASLERVILKALARDPDRRYPTAGALRDALRASMTESRSWIVPTSIATLADLKATGARIASAARPFLARRQHVWLGVAAAFAALTIVWIAVASRSGPTNETTPPAEASTLGAPQASVAEPTPIPPTPTVLPAPATQVPKPTATGPPPVAAPSQERASQPPAAPPKPAPPPPAVKPQRDADDDGDDEDDKSKKPRERDKQKPKKRD